METERLLIRHFTMDDVDDVYREIYSSPAVWGPQPREGVAEGVWLAVLMGRSQTLLRTGSPWAKRAVVLKDSGTFIGQVQLDPAHNYFYRWKDEPNPRFNAVEVELNFAFGQQFWGQSYAFEASQAMIRYAFEELRLPRLVGGTGADNHRSINLHRRLGYTIFEALTPDGQTAGDGIVAVLNNRP